MLMERERPTKTERQTVLFSSYVNNRHLSAVSYYKKKVIVSEVAVVIMSVSVHK